MTRFYTFFLGSLFLLLNTCSVGTYGDAQKAFSAGTEMLNAELLGFATSEEMPELADLYPEDIPSTAAHNARAQFLLAREKLSKLLTKPARLERMHLLGNTHTLLGLTELQLENYPAALSAAEAARLAFAADPGDGMVEEGGRDRAMAYAIEGMVTVNQVYDSIVILQRLPSIVPSDSSLTTQVFSNFIDARLVSGSSTSITGALEALDFAITKVVNSPATIHYLRNVQMAAIANYRATVDRWLVVGQQSGAFRRSQALLDNFNATLADLETKADTYRILLLQASPNGEDDPFYRFWQGRAF